MRSMDELTCPKCDGTMTERSQGRVTVRQCGSCQGVFLDRSDLGNLVEAETDWHAHRSADTARLPRITADMTGAAAPEGAVLRRLALPGLTLRGR